MSKNAQKLPRLGIVGGGQLAKMMLDVAQRLGMYTGVLDPNPNCPASSMSHVCVQADFSDAEAIADFAENYDVLTYDLENVDVSVLLEKSNASLAKKFSPHPSTLELIQDKLLQKQFYQANDIPSAPLLDEKTLHYPCIWKARRGGYDGYGVAKLESSKDYQKFSNNVPDLIETYVDIEKELSVLVARNAKGKMQSYPVVEMLVDNAKNILDRSCSPAQISKAIEIKALSIAKETVNKLNGVGVFAVELILDVNDTIFVNEIAPRPHNSGHHTIEGFNLSQFEQHVRAVCGMPLSPLVSNSPCSGVYNLLADSSYTGKVFIEGLHEVMCLANTYVHIYGKQEAKPGRKMGHVTVLADSHKKLMEDLDHVKELINIRGEEKK